MQLHGLIDLKISISNSYNIRNMIVNLSFSQQPSRINDQLIFYFASRNFWEDAVATCERFKRQRSQPIFEKQIINLVTNFFNQFILVTNFLDQFIFEK